MLLDGSGDDERCASAREAVRQHAEAAQAAGASRPSPPARFGSSPPPVSGTNLDPTGRWNTDWQAASKERDRENATAAQIVVEEKGCFTPDEVASAHRYLGS
jgi:hypothetical protein